MTSVTGFVEPFAGATSVGAYTTIREAADAAGLFVGPATIMLGNGMHSLGSSTLTIDREISIVGESEAGVIIDGSAINGDGVLVEADNVSLSHFTLEGPQWGAVVEIIGIM